MSVRSVFLLAVVLLLAACGDDATVARTSPFAQTGGPATGSDGPATEVGGAVTDGSGPSADPSSTADPQPARASDTTSEGPESAEPAEPTAEAGADGSAIEGTVVAAGGGEPLAWSSVSAGPVETMTDRDGRFSLAAVDADDPIIVVRSGWRSAVVEPGAADRSGGDPAPTLVVELEPFVVRGLRVS